MAGSLYRTMRGKPVDLNRLFNQNEMATPVSLGAVKLNARGEVINPKAIPTEHAVNTQSHVPSQIRKAAKVEPTATQATPVAPVVQQQVEQPISASSALTIAEAEDTQSRKSKKHTEQEAV